MAKKKPPLRGEVYWVILDPIVGHESNKTRPALIVSNDAGNEVSPRVIVAPITSSASQVYPFETKVKLNGIEGKVLLDQIRSIDKRRLAKRIEVLPTSTMREVDTALRVALALP